MKLKKTLKTVLVRKNKLNIRDGIYTRWYMERFWSKVYKTPTCWNWNAYKDNNGYGKFRYGKTMVYTHRFAYELIKGKITKNLTLDHLCRNPSCVNPEHLEAVTQKENVKRGLIGKIPHYNNKKTHCKYGHEFNEENTSRWRTHRECRICKEKRNKKLYEMKKKLLLIIKN